MFYTDNPARDFANYDAEQQRELDRLPVCEYCGHPIQDEELWVINDCLVCDSCAEYHHKKRTEDYME